MASSKNPKKTASPKILKPAKAGTKPAKPDPKRVKTAKAPPKPRQPQRYRGMLGVTVKKQKTAVDALVNRIRELSGSPLPVDIKVYGEYKMFAVDAPENGVEVWVVAEVSFESGGGGSSLQASDPDYLAFTAACANYLRDYHRKPLKVDGATHDYREAADWMLARQWARIPESPPAAPPTLAGTTAPVTAEQLKLVEVPGGDLVASTADVVAAMDAPPAAEILVKARAFSDDKVIDVTFDAAPWLAKAAEADIYALAREEWGHDYAADRVASESQEWNLPLVKLFDYLDSISGVPSKSEQDGFEVEVDSAQAITWIEKNRPDLMPKLAEIQDENNEYKHDKSGIV